MLTILDIAVREKYNFLANISENGWFWGITGAFEEMPGKKSCNPH